MSIKLRKGMFVLVITFAVLGAGCMNMANRNTQQATPSPQVRAQAQDQDQDQAAPGQKVEIAKQAADKVSQVDGVKSANVLVTSQNAYVAAVVDTNNQELSQELKDQIAAQVRSTDPAIQNVYVSTNPEFVDRVNRYVTDVGQGRPVAGFFQEFSQMIQRVFPTQQ